jgi:hypothetical protein
MFVFIGRLSGRRSAGRASDPGETSNLSEESAIPAELHGSLTEKLQLLRKMTADNAALRQTRNALQRWEAQWRHRAAIAADTQPTERDKHAKSKPAPVPTPVIPTASTFYDHESYTCKRLGRIKYSEPTLEREGLQQGRDTMPLAAPGFAPASLRVSYGPWQMAWPNLLTAQHAEWFARYEIASWRAGM